MLYKNLGVVRPSFRGPYNYETIYNKLDVVYLSGNSYVCNSYMIQGDNPEVNDTGAWVKVFDCEGAGLNNKWLFGTWNESRIPDWRGKLIQSTNKVENNGIMPHYLFMDPNIKSRAFFSSASDEILAYWRYEKVFGKKISHLGVYVASSGELHVEINRNLQITFPNDIYEGALSTSFMVEPGWNVLKFENPVLMDFNTYNIDLCPVTCKLWIYPGEDFKDNLTPAGSCVIQNENQTVFDGMTDFYGGNLRLPLDLMYQVN